MRYLIVRLFSALFPFILIEAQSYIVERGMILLRGNRLDQCGVNWVHTPISRVQARPQPSKSGASDDLIRDPGSQWYGMTLVA